MNICAIAAISENNVIGKDGDLPWKLSEDLEHFRSTTMGHPIIMGRKTFDSFPNPLPNREHIVLTRNESLSSSDSKVTYVNSVDEAIKISKKYNKDKLFVIGGQSIYKLFFEQLDEMILTHVKDTYEGDTYFPEFDVDNWNSELVDEKEDFHIVHYYR